MKISICRNVERTNENLETERDLISSAFEELGYKAEYFGYFIPTNSMTKMNRWEIVFNEEKNPIDELRKIIGENISYFFQS